MEVPLEFELSDVAYNRICELMKARAGIDLGAGKRILVQGRLAKRLRQLGLRTFEQYIEYLVDPSADEATRFLNALTTNVTDFFRECHHFELLAQKVLPRVWNTHRYDRRVRIWSAGCSTGEEPYSIAMALLENWPQGSGWDVKILATDIDSDVLSHARAGIYPITRVHQLDPVRLRRFFLTGRGAQEGFVRVPPELQALITWKHLNLLEPWPMRGPFDVVFCRNVVIYFDAVTRRPLVRRYADILGAHGHLFVGQSESLMHSSVSLVPCGRTAYRKRARPDAAP